MNTLPFLYLNSIFYLIIVLYSLIIIPIFSLIVAVMSLFLTHEEAMGRFRRAISWYGKGIIHLLPFPFVKIEYTDLGRDPKNQGYIIICNHRSASDPFLMACLPYEAVQVVNIWPFRIPFLGFYGRMAQYLSVREMPFETFLQKSCALLKRGVSIIAFPEGTRSGSSKMGQFHSAMFRVAQKSMAPIIPICITGNENIPTKDFIMHPGVIKIHKLKAIKWEDYKDLTPFKLKNWIREIIQNELLKMEKKS